MAYTEYTAGSDGFVSCGYCALYPEPEIRRAERLAGRHPYALHSAKKLFQGFLQAVWQCQTYVLHVRWANLNLIQQPAHTPRLLGAEQVALARTPAHHFSGRRDLEALRSSAVRLRLHFLVLLHDFLFRFTASRFNSLRSREVNAVHAISNLQTFQLLFHFCKDPKFS
jgi:hypothetical protein